MPKRSILILLGAIAVAAAFAFVLLRPAQEERSTVFAGGSPAAERSASTGSGAALFAANCAACHGERGGGTDKGPPLVHRIYEPGHHPDIAFLVAVQNGVRAHHWSFGNMPPQPQVSEGEVVAIVAYVRSLQRAQGIY